MNMKLFFATLMFVSFFMRSQTQFKIEQNQLILPSPILFETGSNKIKLEESKASLMHIKQYLDEKTYVSLIRIESHSDNSGNEVANQDLTSKRSKAVYDWLVANGIDCKRMIAAAFGSTKPIADNGTAEGKAENRRVSIFMAELRGRAIGGMPVDGGGTISATCK